MVYDCASDEEENAVNQKQQADATVEAFFGRVGRRDFDASPNSRDSPDSPNSPVITLTKVQLPDRGTRQKGACILIAGRSCAVTRRDEDGKLQIYPNIDTACYQMARADVNSTS